MAFWNKRRKGNNSLVDFTAKKIIEDPAQVDFQEKIKKQAERRNAIFNGQRHDADDYGYSISNPICTSTIEHSSKYLSRLLTEKGEKLYWMRVGSFDLKECNGVPNVIVDHYCLYLNGSKYADIYICPYAHNCTYTPKGMILAEENDTTKDNGDLSREAQASGMSVEQYLKIQQLWFENNKRTLPYISIFMNIYNKALSTLSAQALVHNAEFELLPAMFVIADYSCLSSNKNRQLVGNGLSSFIVKKYQLDEASGQLFDSRVDFYGSVVRGKPLRADWLPGQTATVQNADAIVRCATALGDILINPECANDYENTPVLLYDVFTVSGFSDIYINEIIPLFVELFKQIYDVES